jgi:hypothetical protein
MPRKFSPGGALTTNSRELTHFSSKGRLKNLGFDMCLTSRRYVSRLVTLLFGISYIDVFNSDPR